MVKPYCCLTKSLYIGGGRWALCHLLLGANTVQGKEGRLVFLQEPISSTYKDFIKQQYGFTTVRDYRPAASDQTPGLDSTAQAKTDSQKTTSQALCAPPRAWALLCIRSPAVYTYYGHSLRHTSRTMRPHSRCPTYVRKTAGTLKGCMRLMMTPTYLTWKKTESPPRRNSVEKALTCKEASVFFGGPDAL